MKKRSLIYALLAIGIAASLSSCRNDAAEPIAPAEGQLLTFLPSVKGMNEEVIRTRSSSSFFENDDEITVKITTSKTGATTQDYIYAYNGGTFTGVADGFKFTPDQTYITKLEALWPAEDSDARKTIITDQRNPEDYKQANRLKATGNTENIMPTAEPVPLVFEHEQSRITFRLAGQNANGLIIKSLLLELKVDLGDEEEEKGVGLGFWAYCEENGTLNARMILPAGSQFGPDKENEGRMKIGLVTVGTANSDANDYRGVIYIPNRANILLEANHDYLVTLTPEGYDMNATISISGFSQSEGRLAVPYQLPDKVDENRYEIRTIAQLITISWLLSDEPLSQAWDTVTPWGEYTFDIVNAVVVSDKVKAEGYLKAEVLRSNIDKFTNTGNVTYSDGAPVFGE